MSGCLLSEKASSKVFIIFTIEGSPLCEAHLTQQDRKDVKDWLHQIQKMQKGALQLFFCHGLLVFISS